MASRASARHLLSMQIASCRGKIKSYPNASARVSDGAEQGGGEHDAVCCFFLLHELPDATKCKVVDALLASVRPGARGRAPPKARPFPVAAARLLYYVYRQGESRPA